MTSETTKSKNVRNWRLRRHCLRSRAEKNYAKVEKMFYLYNEIKKAVKLARDEQGYYQSGHKEGGGSSNHAFISDPTAQLARKHLEPIKVVLINSGTLQEDKIKRPEEWIEVVDKTLKEYPQNTLVGYILRKRYIENEHMATTCIDLDIKPENYRKYYKASSEGIEYGKDCALQMGLIFAF